jgi:hypothetical protein
MPILRGDSLRIFNSLRDPHRLSVSTLNPVNRLASFIDTTRSE